MSSPSRGRGSADEAELASDQFGCVDVLGDRADRRRRISREWCTRMRVPRTIAQVQHDPGAVSAADPLVSLGLGSHRRDRGLARTPVTPRPRLDDTNQVTPKKFAFIDEFRGVPSIETLDRHVLVECAMERDERHRR